MHNHTRRSRVFRFWAALAVVLAVPATLAISTSAATAAGSNALTVKAGEYTYVLKGSPKAGWTEITFDNAGVEDHMLAIFKLKKGTTAAQLKKAFLAGDDAGFEKIAPPGGDPTVSGGPPLLSPKQKTTTLTQLPAGTYGIACYLIAPDGKSHAEHGMYKVFTVSGKSTLKPPTDGVSTMSINDSGITLPSSGMPAHGWIKVTNNASVTRDVTLAQYVGDATFDQAGAYYNAYFATGKAPAGDAPATLNGGIGGIAKGGSGYFEVDLAKGRYAVVSGNGDLEGPDTNPLHTDFTVG